MKKEEIHFGDWKRILLGNVPGEFMLEVFLRTIVVYLILLVVIRLLGKRMSAQLTITEMAVFITLGAIVSLPMQAPDRGILPGVLILICVLLLQRGLNYFAFKDRRVETTTQGDVSMLVKDGILQLDEMRKTAISHAQLYAQIRAKEILQLGAVKRMYVEGNGDFSIYPNAQPKPGLSVLPSRDESIHRQDEHADDLRACTNCATVVPPDQARTACPTCGQQNWTYAVK
ncbi:DUF421 domain-containing protein [Hymenobacter sp. GOD-10R]|uniref:DUF421 domain-containing protein n=1 Tax=Hymenobacter sp. GOD-10R TaxID=3093922 RepID=UPI002D76D747|nr:YetF domain-containing protein [Hymenobacter sp. GOD-10R]WRQ30038.1 YetF domain-containing protein [Hymenobacter sp. GOD-10R]